MPPVTGVNLLLRIGGARQLLTLAGGADADTYTLTYYIDGAAFTTVPIRKDAAAATVASALAGLGSQAVGIAVTGAARGPYTIDFSGTVGYPAWAAPLPTIGGVTADVNLITSPDDMSGGAWARDAVTVVAGLGPSPSGAPAEHITAQVAGSAAYDVHQANVVAGAGTILASIDLKQDTYRYGALELFNGTDGFFGKLVVDLSNGAIVTSTGTVSVVALGGGWYRLTIQATTTHGNNAIYVLMTDAAGTNVWGPSAGTEAIFAARPIAYLAPHLVVTPTQLTPAWTTLGGQRGATFTRGATEANATTKDSAGWHEGQPVDDDWSVDCEHFLLEGDAAYLALEQIYKQGVALNADIAFPSGSIYTGSATLEKFPVNAPHDNLVSVALSLKGSGALLKA